jgi:hypothetical protein
MTVSQSPFARPWKPERLPVAARLVQHHSGYKNGGKPAIPKFDSPPGAPPGKLPFPKRSQNSQMTTGVETQSRHAMQTTQMREIRCAPRVMLRHKNVRSPPLPTRPHRKRWRPLHPMGWLKINHPRVRLPDRNEARSFLDQQGDGLPRAPDHSHGPPRMAHAPTGTIRYTESLLPFPPYSGQIRTTTEMSDTPRSTCGAFWVRHPTSLKMCRVDWGQGAPYSSPALLVRASISARPKTEDATH